MSWEDTNSQPSAQTGLDTLPLRIAVIDTDGVIVETNKNWREFGAEQGVSDPAMIGTHYFDGGGGAELHSYRGIRAVLDGERDLFVHEYPCDTSDGKRWFMLRAAPFVSDGQRFVTVAHIDITERIRQEQRRDSLLNRIEGLITDVSSLLSTADSPEIVLRELPRRLVTVDGYRVAWTGRRDLANSKIETVGAAGPTPVSEGYTINFDTEDAGSSPVVDSLTQGQSIVTEIDPEEDTSAASIPVEEHISREIAVPIRFKDVTYGLLSVCTDDSVVFQEQEIDVVTAIARIVGQGIASLEHRHLLAGSGGVALRFEGIVPGVPLSVLSRTVDAEVTVLDIVDRGEEWEIVCRISNGSQDDIRREIQRLEGASHESLIQTADSTIGRIAITDPLLEAVQSEMSILESYSVVDGTVTVRLLVESRRQARHVYDRLTTEWASLNLIAITDRESPLSSAGTIHERFASDLTDRQAQAVRLAHHAGYFDSDRAVTGETLAAAMGVTRQTYHQHLRAAQQKIFNALFEARSTGSPLLTHE